MNGIFDVQQFESLYTYKKNIYVWISWIKWAKVYIVYNTSEFKLKRIVSMYIYIWDVCMRLCSYIQLSSAFNDKNHVDDDDNK